eukprot:scaffold81171_cov51-Phaeocystis_antarctica.AAC.1
MLRQSWSGAGAVKEADAAGLMGETKPEGLGLSPRLLQAVYTRGTGELDMTLHFADLHVAVRSASSNSTPPNRPSPHCFSREKSKVLDFLDRHNAASTRELA